MSGRVGVNLLWLVPDVVGGSEEYTTGMLTALGVRPPHGIELVVLANREVLTSFPELEEHFETVAAPVSGRRKGSRVVAENSWLAAASGRLHLDLIHHLGGIMPFVVGCPGIVTVHDLQPLVMPRHFGLTKRLFARLSIPQSVRRARMVVTLTEFTRRMIVERFELPEERVVVVPVGIEIPDERRLALEREADVRERYSIGERHLFLYPAITYAHKNHCFLLEAFARVLARHPDTVLVLTGGSGPEEDLVHRTIGELGLERQVLRVGRVPRRHLDALYQEATALVFPSRFEGFGIPLLEAMSRGCPVVAADATSLPEVGGDACVLLPLGDVGAWSSAMCNLIEDPGERSRLALLGGARAATFDWSSISARMGDLYRQVLEEL